MMGGGSTKNKLALAATVCAMVALIFSTTQVMDSARNALRLCAFTILPSLFPFFVISILLNKLGLPRLLGKRFAPLAERLFGVSGQGATALFVGLTGGYPLGAAYVADMVHDELIESEEAERLLCFCNNSGPAFLIGAVGVGVFGSSAAGLLLYAAHAAAALLTGFCFRGSGTKTTTLPDMEQLSFSSAFPQSVRQAVSSVLSVCGFVVCFSVLVALFDVHGLFSAFSALLSAATGMKAQAAQALLTGFWEIGSAAGVMQGLPATPENLALAAAILGWGGLSVHCQTAAVLCEAELSLKRHTLGRFMSAVLSAVLIYLISPLFL